MPDDRRLTISTSSRLHPDEVARHTFGTARRGFDPAEVRVFLEQIAREMESAADREEELQAAMAEAERRAANPVLDEATLTAALGQETARVLRSAHDAATELVTKAEADASRLRAQAEDEATQLQTRAEQNAAGRIAQAEAVASDVKRRTQEEVASKLEASKLEAEELVAQARAECRAMVQEAQEVRAKVLADLTRRRRVLHSQIEQLRAGRERLAETITDVRHTVDRITDELFRAEDEARLAAEAAGRQAAQEGPDEAPRSSSAAVGLVAAPAPEEIGTGALVEDETARRQAVDDLFARLRAERHRTADGAHDGPRSDEQLPVGPVPDGEPTSSAAAPSPPRTAAAAPPAPADARQAAPGSAGEPVEGDAVPRDPRLAERDEILNPVVSTLVRRLKRALQDDQNDILDRVRAGGGWGPDVLPSTDDHQQRYLTAAVEHLRDAARSGATFAGGKPDDAPPVDAVAGELAAAIVVPLRRRLDGAGGSVDVGDDSALIEHVGAAFRDWKGGRVERLAGDHALAAFSQASLAAAPSTTTLRWVVDDGGTQCPDCDDNALAGPLRRGEVFPTGHPCPPAHAGCRCLLAPAEA
ncbi:MAG TPA: DivIVA domain-containing protein [Acidimicrobiales bacterium]|nr:DivIVA domain-containing protein [Acidimicrobiales bacterium]